MVEGSSIFLQPRQDEPSLQQTAGTSIKTEGGCLQPKMYPCKYVPIYVDISNMQFKNEGGVYKKTRNR